MSYKVYYSFISILIKLNKMCEIVNKTVFRISLKWETGLWKVFFNSVVAAEFWKTTNMISTK